MPRWSAVPPALCLVLFPLSFLLLSNTGLHPGYAGTAAEQIQGLAAASARWRWVHLGLAGGSLLGLGALLTLRSLLSGPRIAAHAAAAIGVAGAALLTGIFTLEATLIPALAQACVEAAAACLAPANQEFLARFADLALNRVPFLFQSGGALLASLFALAAMGWRAKTLAPREALPLLAGAALVFLYGPALHGVPLGLPFIGFLIMLGGSAALAVRLMRAPPQAVTADGAAGKSH